MKKREITGNISMKRLLSLPEAQAYLSLGYVSARKIAEESGAVVKIGRRVLYDRQALDNYIDGQIGQIAK